MADPEQVNVLRQGPTARSRRLAAGISGRFSSGFPLAEFPHVHARFGVEVPTSPGPSMVGVERIRTAIRHEAL